MKLLLEHELPGRAHRAALTLLEMMVAVTLLAVIMIGLLAVFNQTQKALHIVSSQTDVFENARGAIQIIGRDLAEATLYDDTNVTAVSIFSFPSPVPGGVLPLPSGTNQILDFTEAFWLTRANDDWRGIGYFVLDDPVLRANNGVGTLYRFTGQVRRDFVPGLLSEFFKTSPTNTHRVSDGVVHFSMQAVFVTNNAVATNFIRASSLEFSTKLPAFVDVELGVLEPDTLKQYQALRDIDLPAAKRFLVNHAGNIHFFRERVPIRNFINPHRAHEVP